MGFCNSKSIINFEAFHLAISSSIYLLFLKRGVCTVSFKPKIKFRTVEDDIWPFFLWNEIKTSVRVAPGVRWIISGWERTKWAGECLYFFRAEDICKYLKNWHEKIHALINSKVYTYLHNFRTTISHDTLLRLIVCV